MRLKKSHLILLPLLGAAVYFGVRSSLAGQSPQAVPTPALVTVPVTRGDVTQTVLAPGMLVSTREQVLSAPQGGLIESLLVAPGSIVAAGDPVAALQGGEGEPSAPFEGVVVEVYARPGETLGPGQPLALIVDPRALEVRATVIEEDLPLIEVGQPAELFFDAAPGLAAAGQVARIVPYRIPREDRPLYEVYLTLEDPAQQLVPGMTADAVITVARADAVLRLPRGVLRVGQDGTAAVEVLADGGARERQVRTGLRGDSYIEVVDGLAEDDLVLGE